MKLKTIILNSIPYALATRLLRKRNDLMEKEYIYAKAQPIPEVESKYKYILSCQGFGFSGSGVISDLLREYNNVEVFGSVDIEGSLGSASTSNEEIDFIRHKGGILDMEKYISGYNLFSNDAMLHLLIDNFRVNYLCQKSPECGRLAKNYVANLIGGILDCNNGSDYNGILQSPVKKHYNVLYLKNLTLDEYRDLSKNFLTHFFNTLHQRGEDGKDILVLDQFFNDFEYDNQKNLKYVPNLKTVFVYRDPRDVFAFANKEKVSWLPYQNVDTFIMMYKNIINRLDFESEEYLVIRFEDITTSKYDEWVERIERYLGLDKMNHISPKSCFDPASSCKSIGRWKQMPELKDDFDKILAELPEICYQP